MAHHELVNQRRSYNGDLCTIRYVGKVEGTSGEWLGVEWDDPTRGKHSGQHQGERYFTCLRNHPTAGSFVRPSRPADGPRGFIEALREKYASEFEQSRARQARADADAAQDSETPIQFNGKIAEEVGFDKIRKQLAELEELKIVLLDGLRVAGVLAQEASREQIEEARGEIARICPKITELDLSRNLFTAWENVADVCGSLERLKLLRLNGNRFASAVGELLFKGIEELHLDDTLLPWDQISAAAARFPALTSLSASANQLSLISTPLSNTITTLILGNNDFTSLGSIKTLSLLKSLRHISLRGCRIETVAETGSKETFQFSPNLQSVDLSRNKINSWQFINEIPQLFPGLQNLRVSGNPLYNQSVAPSAVTGLPEKPMTVDEAYMFTLSRISALQVLNYSTITEKDRSNGELYYLSLIGKELSASPETAESDILKAHPRYHDLCQIYGEPLIARASKAAGSTAAINPRSVAARLVRIAFHLSSGNTHDTSSADGVKVKEIPRSYDTYQVKAIASRLYGLTPFEFRLIWETDELDPVSKENMDIEDEWDSEDEDGQGLSTLQSGEDDKFVKREVELVDTTKDIGFWFQSDLVEARVRIELTSRS
ncbi:hypothetical protein ASPCAL01839 [Aspergillus calidoustus]|uniref:Tubulin-specific chaperone E n=1 Tax=Aspergillus calidoustus TaxID=454130 RepID=A0A0U5HDQ3_ASPCI|nr:hypothetical protein ASPCAL01839 [Aspergillus calidoustus]